MGINQGGFMKIIDLENCLDMKKCMEKLSSGKKTGGGGSESSGMKHSPHSPVFFKSISVSDLSAPQAWNLLWL